MEVSPVSSISKTNAVDEIHVLVVDDNLLDRVLVERLLKKNFSCKVTTAENGFKALQHLGMVDDQQSSTDGHHGANVNLIITDYSMPGMTGYELLKKIKQSSKMEDIPVVILSSEDDRTLINKCLEEGAQMYMLKPLKQSDVERLRCKLM